MIFGVESLDKWDRRFMAMADFVATWSKDPSKKVGAIVVSPDLRLLSTGFNGFPRGVADTAERLQDKELKRKLSVHAEVNAMDNADRSVRGWLMYITEAPCMPCACSIIQRGIDRVLCRRPFPVSRWHEEQVAASDILLEAGVRVSWIKHEPMPEEM